MPLLSTSDGGRHWRRDGLLPQGCKASPGTALDFANARDGWCGTESEVSAPATLYRTTDGGRSWHHLTPPGPPASNPSKCGYNALFDTPEVGWATVSSCRTPANQLYETTDGGSTWTKTKLPAPPGTPRPGLVTFVLPVGTGARLALGGYGTDGTTVVYRSGDRGRTWTPVAAPGRPNVWAISLISPTQWRLIDGRRILATDNAGVSWHTIRAGITLTLTDESHALPATTTFVTPTVGWYVAGGEVETISRTTNDGTTWKAITIPSVNPK